jgi:hypothetical protein
MNIGALVCSLIFAVTMIAFLAKEMDTKPQETQNN